MVLDSRLNVSDKRGTRVRKYLPLLHPSEPLEVAVTQLVPAQLVKTNRESVSIICVINVSGPSAEIETERSVALTSRQFLCMYTHCQLAHTSCSAL